MPITIAPISRRGFLAGTLAAGFSWAFPHRASAAGTPADANRFALMGDTHISADLVKPVREQFMSVNFAKARDAILQLDSPPAAVLIAGDVALNSGEPGDYAQVGKLLAPIQSAGIPIHIALGNHDRHTNFWKAFPKRKHSISGLTVKKHVNVIETPRANWFLLDSLDVEGAVPGRLGKEQIQWLIRELDARPDKPALLFVHHDPDSKREHGLIDTEALFEQIIPRKQVKAYFYGHTHIWQQTKREGIHLINLPPTGYVFEEKRPLGWVDVRLQAKGATLVLNALDKKHPDHGQTIELPWRS